MLALFLGAGFSKWAANLPLASELFDFAVVPDGPREAKKLEIVASHFHDWKEKHPDGLDEQFVAEALTFLLKDRQAVVWYITRRLSEPFIWREFHSQRWRRHVLMIDENRRFKIEGVSKARDFLMRFWVLGLAGIITSNYDMLVEYSLGTKQFNYGTPHETLIGRGPYPVSTWKKPITVKGKIPLAKIHGSVSWDEEKFYTDGRRGLTGHALIVAPAPEKQPPASLMFASNLASRILERSTRLIVFGFAFNPYDEAVLKLLKSNGSNVEAVLLIDVNPQIERARTIWPHAKIMSCSPPPKGNAEIQIWQQTFLGN